MAVRAGPLLALAMLAICGTMAQAFYTIPGFTGACLAAKSDVTPYAANLQIDIQFVPTSYTNGRVSGIANTIFPYSQMNKRNFPYDSVKYPKYILSLLPPFSLESNDQVWDPALYPATKGISPNGIAFSFNVSGDVRIKLFSSGGQVFLKANKAACDALKVRSGAEGFPACSATGATTICRLFGYDIFQAQWTAPRPPPRPPAPPSPPRPPRPPGPPRPPKPSPRPPRPPRPSPRPRPPRPSPRPPTVGRRAVTL